MANHERIDLSLEASPVKNYIGGVAADDIPEEMIHRIQSFMDARLAARSTVLSKSWHRAWLTRPDLDFRDQYFQFPSIEFPGFALNTLQRYEDRNRRIDSFRLEMVRIADHYLATKLISKAIRLGATNLTLQIRRSASGLMFFLPYEVLDSETLAGFSAHECLIHLLLFGKKELSWPNLKTLSLSYVVTYGDLFLNLILKCPSLEKITLDSNVSFRTMYAQRRLGPSCDSIIKLHKLKSLRLIGLESSKDYIYRHDLWPKFPCLKELVVWGYDYHSVYDWTGIRICSPSLELITLYMYDNRITNGTFDVPNIRKFKVVGVYLPQLDEFKTSNDRKWESDIQIKCDQLTVSWFSSLNKLLRMLSPSRISLSVGVTYSFVGRHTGYFGDGLPIPIVENVLITGHDRRCFCAFLNALLQSCRPNCISVDTRFIGNVNLEALFQMLGYRPCERHDLSIYQQYIAKFQLI
ncbi:putative F-box/FBD/LRR-repeat protein isoform X1 [Salvia divinorum]|uniref:F-box/FBD/LRR-repeat protein isoform X1 n=1 Tax=Salvia divinorum TaxID=28513 RepID=A0ABD1H985_SALDI